MADSEEVQIYLLPTQAADASALSESDVLDLISTSLTSGASASSSAMTVGSYNNVFKVSNDGMWLGNADIDAASFSVRMNGAMTATGGTFSGSITASSGAIGGFDIGTDYVRDVANSFGLASTVTAGDDVRFWAGSTFANRATASFRITESGLMSLGQSGSNAYMVLDGPNNRMGTSDYAATSIGWRINGTGSAEFLDVTIRGTIRTSVFEKDVISVVNGVIVVSSGDALDATMTALDSATLTTAGNTTFSNDSILHLKDETNEEYIRVISRVGNVYTVTRDLAGAYSADNNPTWKNGTCVAKEGNSDLSSVFSGGYLRLLGEGTNSPRYGVFKRTGAAYSAITEYVGLGNLNGLLDYVADDYGIAIGTTDSFMSYDATNGLRVSGDVNQQVTATSSEALLIGDFLCFSSADHVVRYSPTAIPSTFDQSASQATTLVYNSSVRLAKLIKLSTTLSATVFLDNGGGVPTATLSRIPTTAASGAIGTISSDTSGVSVTTPTTIDALAMDSTRVLVCASKSNSLHAAIADLTSSISFGSDVTVDSTDVIQGFCEYINDSHVLFISKVVSSGNIQYHKYTASGSALSSATSGTLTTALAGNTFTIKGVRKFLGTSYLLIIVQDDTAAVAKAIIAHYDTTSSTFDSVGTPVSFSGGQTLLNTAGAMAELAQLSSTEMMVACPTSTTAGKIFAVTRPNASSTVPTIGTMNAMPASGANAGYSLTRVNARCAFLNTQSGLTATIQLWELNSASTDIVVRATTTTASAPSAAGSDLESNAFTCAWQANPTRMGLMGFIGSSDDISVGTGLVTLPPPLGIGKSTVASSASIVAVTGGRAVSLVTLLATQRYYADWGGLLTTESNGTPDKVGVTKDTDELIVKSW